MSSDKNSRPWFSFSMIAVLLISFSIIAIYPSLSASGKISAVELNCDKSSDMERSESEKDITEEPVSLYHAEISKVNFQNICFIIKRSSDVVSIPSVYYDIHLLPPEYLIG